MQGLFAGTATLALLAAVFWGGGDFAGSIAVKRMGGRVRGALVVVLAGHIMSLLLVASLAAERGEAFPHGAPLLWAIGGGALSGVSLVAFYIALADGHMGSAAAVSGLLCAAVPALVSGFTEGSPGLRRLLGFAFAAAAIWLIAASGALLLAGMFLLPRKTRSSPDAHPGRARTFAWIAAGAGLDTGGNMSFLAATRAGRLDVAAVLASIYPASTILLAAWLLKERTTARQRWGMALALVAVVLVTL